MNMANAYRATAPHPFAYLISRDADGKVNAMGVSWWTFASSDPAMLLVCVGNKKHTLEIVRSTMRFALCLPDVSLREQARKICSTSGARVDKVKAFGIDIIPGQTGMPVLRQARARFECGVKQIVETGDHALCVAEILAFSEDPALEALRTADTGYSL